MRGSSKAYPLELEDGTQASHRCFHAVNGSNKNVLRRVAAGRFCKDFHAEDFLSALRRSFDACHSLSQRCWDKWIQRQATLTELEPFFTGKDSGSKVRDPSVPPSSPHSPC